MSRCVAGPVPCPGAHPMRLSSLVGSRLGLILGFVLGLGGGSTLPSPQGIATRLGDPALWRRDPEGRFEREHIRSPPVPDARPMRLSNLVGSGLGLILGFVLGLGGVSTLPSPQGIATRLGDPALWRRDPEGRFEREHIRSPPVPDARPMRLSNLAGSGLGLILGFVLGLGGGSTLPSLQGIATRFGDPNLRCRGPEGRFEREHFRSPSMRGVARAFGPRRSAPGERARLEVEAVESGSDASFGCLALASPEVLLPEAGSWAGSGASISREWYRSKVPELLPVGPGGWVRLEVEAVKSRAPFGCMSLAPPMVMFPEAGSRPIGGVSASRRSGASRTVAAGSLPVRRGGALESAHDLGAGMS